MANNNQDNDLSFLEKKDANALSLKDVYYTVMRHIHWILLGAAVGGVLAYYHSDRSDRIYESHARIKINSVTRNRLDNGASMLENITNRRVAISMNAINDEITVIRAETPIRDVVLRLGLNTSYKYKTRIIKRVKDMYKDTPILVSLPDLKESDFAALDVTVQADSSLLVEIGETEKVTGRLFDTLSTSYGRVVVEPTWALRELYFDNPIMVRRQSVVDVADHYRYVVQVERNSSTDGIVDLSLKDTNPQRAADILNEMIAVYNEGTINEKKEIIRQTSEYINTRIAQLDSELGAQESEIASFKRNNQILDLQNYGQSYLTTSIESSEEVERLQAQISHAQYLMQFTSENSENKLFPVAINIEDENILTTIARFNELVLKLDKYKESGSTNNPIVRDMLLEQSALKNNLNQLLSTYVSALRQKLESVQAVGQRANEKMQQVPGSQLYIDNLARVQGIKEELYLTLLSKREELLIGQPSLVGNADIIDRARVNPVPVEPNLYRDILIGVLLGMLIPFILFFLVLLFDTKVRFRKDVEKYTDIPFLGEIPAKEKGDDRLVVADSSKRDQISEAFRILRSNVEFTRNTESSSTVYLFLSLMESSGKTFLTTNLAASLAQVERKVILLDLDLRKGTFTRNWHERKAPGFSNYLSGKTDDFDALIQHDIVVPGVDAITTGPLPPNPAELLSSKRLDHLMEELRKRYEFIIIDAVPAGIVADANVLKRFADVSVFVLRSGLVDRRMLPDLQELRDKHEFPGITIILNDVKLKKNNGYGYGGYGYGYGYGYGHGYGYGYGFGYGYGYGNDEEEDHRTKFQKFVDSLAFWKKKKHHHHHHHHKHDNAGEDVKEA